MFAPPIARGGGSPYESAGAVNVNDDLEKKKKEANGGQDEGTSTMMAGVKPAESGAPATTQLPPTFTQMQMAGYARPAPPTQPTAPTVNADGSVAPAPPPIPGANPTFGLPQPAAVPGAPVTPGAPAVTPGAPAGGAPAAAPSSAGAALQALLMNPSGYADGGFMAQMAKEGRAIDDEFAQRETAAREEMMARGLGDSSILGGRLQDLNVAKRSAQQGLAETLGIKQAETASADKRAAIALQLQKEGMDADTAYRMANMEMQKDQFAQSLGFNREELSARLAESAADRGLRREDMTFQHGATNRQLSLAEKSQADEMEKFAKMFGLDLEKFGYSQKRDAADDAFRDKSFDYNKSRDDVGDQRYADEKDYRGKRDAVGDDQWQKEFDFTKDTRSTDDIMRLWEILMRDYMGAGAGG